jgi:hypothetical protein
MMMRSTEARPRMRITLRQAALRYRVTVQSLLQAVRTHRLGVLRAGRDLWVRPQDVETCLAMALPHVGRLHVRVLPGATAGDVAGAAA